MIEVLVALAIIAISLGALVQNSVYMVRHLEQLKQKTIAHIVQTQAATMIQLGVLPLAVGQTASERTVYLGQPFYWRATLEKTKVPTLNKITILISPKIAGPFVHPYTAYAYRGGEHAT